MVTGDNQENPAVQQSDPYCGMLLNGRYMIEKELGRGGIGVVYLARDKQLLMKPVVVKVLLDESAQIEWTRQKFRQEIEALTRIDHPGIVGVLDAGEMPDSKPYFVMQFVEGATLRSSIRPQGMDLAIVGQLIRQIGQALSAAHEKGVYHRDLKPANIMIQKLSEGEQQVKIIDFGIAKVEDSKLGINTMIPVVVGTVSYMSPEQLMASPATAASDIFALGVIAYEMITGQLPFRPESMFQLLDLQRAGVKIKPQTVRPELPEAAEATILKALSFSPQDRFFRARDFGDELARALASEARAAEARGSRQTGEHELTPKVSRPSRYGQPPEAHDPPTATNVSPINLVENTEPLSAVLLDSKLEPIGGAVPLDSEFYIVRTTDDEFRAAIARQDSIVLVKGARQMGKTSLLARGLQLAREHGAKVVLTNFQKLNAAHFESPEKFYLALAELIADQLDLDVQPDEVWNARRGPNINFERYLRREVLGKIAAPLVWGMDEVDRLFTCSFGSEVFGLFRSWHNERSLDPSGPWRRLTLAIAYATEAHLFITDMNQSPFNVGTRLALEDFNFDQVVELNQRYGAPLKDRAEVARYFRLLGGHPYLVRRGLFEMASHGLNIAGFEAVAERDEGPFGDHLRRILALLGQDNVLADIVRGILQGQPCPSAESFYRLRSAGVMSGETVRDVRPRCQLYATYLERHLL